MEELEYIKKFNKIKISNICKKLKIDSSNLLRGKTKKENYILVKKCIENEIAHLYIRNDKNE